MKIKFYENNDETLQVDTTMPVITICARIINKLFVDGYTIEEIAEIVDCPVQDIIAIYGDNPADFE